ncbi:MAG: hypothetical protein L0Z73_07665 [Gammaproteobacteria bacterium]|nr:hypothetical protein [Gammaproteobacteria bacterium]
MDQNLYRALTSSCVEYIAHSVAGEKEVSLEFAGRFECRPVVWFATIRCLPDNNSGVRQQQYIDVQGNESAHLRVEVGLPLKVINESDILKTIMMIRQYRNLRRGRHEFSGGYKKAD